MTVTLEPCSHFGKTPPCTDAIIKAGIKRVVAASKDPNPMVAGNGFKKLKDAGIEVIYGVLEEEAVNLNEIFNKYILTGIPFVTLKVAMTSDGKIATSEGHSKWISNLKSRQISHKLRHLHDAILVGAGTVLNDDPSLTTRLTPFKGKNPIRIIIDGKLRLDPNFRVFSSKEAPTILVTVKGHLPERLNLFKDKGIEILELPGKGAKINPYLLLRELGNRKITSLLLEGGSSTIGSFLDNKCIDKVYIFVSPKVAGGQNAISAIGGEGVLALDNAPQITKIERFFIEEDTLIVGKLKYKG